MKKIYTQDEIAEQRELDLAERDKLWATLAEEAGGGERGRGIVEAFKVLYTLYRPGLADWFSKLYDPELGGYYATTSGHDTVGYGPDVEATIQSLRFIESSGMIRNVGTIHEALPKGMIESIVRFVKGLQNENGYFYHPQWTFNDVHYNLSRRGRDLGFATGILDWFGASPTYDAPNGKKGDGLDKNGDPVIGYRTKVSEGANEATEEKGTPPYPEYLENKETFERYLQCLDIRNQSYGIGNQLNATYHQIRARAETLLAEGADYDLREILINWLNERIDPSTGYWGPEVNFAGSNGFFKIITLYNVWGYPYPYPEKVTDSVISNIMGDEIPSGNCCSVYNLWCAIVSIKRNARRAQPEKLRDKVIAGIDEILRRRGAEAILNTYKKMAPFKKGDAFSGQYDASGGSQQTLYVGLSSFWYGLEGSVDATCICSSGLTRAMFDAFEFTKVPFLGTADWMVYRNNLLTYGPAKKTIKPDPNISFSDPTLPAVQTPFGACEAKVENGIMTARISEGGAIGLVQSARICKGDYRVFEADITVSDISGDSALLFAPAVRMVDFKASGFVEMKFSEGEVVFENRKWSEGFSYTHKLSSDTFRLRVEFYLENKKQKANPGRLSSAARVFVDGKYIGKYVNDDGTDKKYPTGINLNNEHHVVIAAVGNTSATISLPGYYFAYYTED